MTDTAEHTPGRTRPIILIAIIAAALVALLSYAVVRLNAPAQPSRHQPPSSLTSSPAAVAGTPTIPETTNSGLLLSVSSLFGRFTAHYLVALNLSKEPIDILAAEINGKPATHYEVGPNNHPLPRTLLPGEECRFPCYSARPVWAEISTNKGPVRYDELITP